LKNLLTTIVVILLMTMFTGQAFGQETTTNKAVRIYAGYFGVVGPETHHGTSVYLSIPLNTMKLRLGFFGRSIAWETYQSRGGFAQLSKLINQPTDNPRYRLGATITYSAENLVGAAELPHKQFAATVGGSITFDPWPKFTAELGVGIGYAAMLKLPKDSILKPEKSSAAMQISFGLSYGF